MEDECNIAVRYRTVRKHLDSLGYKHALTLDALPLIEKLLADLIQTTESLKHFKSIAQENIEAHTQLQSAIDPYKCDNVRLVQECNQLHLDLIKEKESHQRQIKDYKKEIHKLERECNDLQLVSSRNLHRIKELEIESAKKSKKILELQGKCLKPTISNVGLASKKRPAFPLRRPVLESEPLPKSGAKSAPLPNLGTVEPKIVDLLSMADHKMNCLSHEVTKLKGELSLQIDNVQTLKCQLTTKEKEILRLKKMLEGGRPYSAVSRDCSCKKADNNFAMANHNVDANELKILQQEKLELEQQLKEALNKQHDAMSQALKLADRNEELEKELRDIDHIALAVEADCNSAVKENNKRVSKLQEKLENVMQRVHILEDELTAERRGVQELRANLEACKLEKLNIERTLESALDEKKQMTDRINELTVIETNLNDEIERLAKENEKQKQDIVQLQYSNKLLKHQINVKEISLDHDGVNSKGSKEKGRKNDYNREQNGIDLHEIYKEREIHQNESSAGYNSVLKQLNEKEIQINDLQQTFEQLRRERDFYRNEFNNIKDNYNKTIEKDHIDLWSRLRELKRQLNEKENALDNLQRENEKLFREKVNLETRLQTCKGEHKVSCRPCNVCKRVGACNCSPSAMKDSKVKGIIERLEHERNIARADVERLIEERDALRERLKIATEAHTSEQRRLRENLTDVETRLKQIEKERQDLLLTQGARRATINGLEDQLQDLREELRRTKQELGTQRTQYFQLRALQDQTDQALGDAQNQLTQSEIELNKTLDRNRAMERQQLQLENQVKELQQEISNHKANMTHLDHEKDQLLMVLDEKTERIAALEREIMLKDQQVMGSEHQIRELQHKNDICVDQSADQERQLRSMQMEMENIQRQLQSATYDRENAIQENRRIQDDLAAATCEVRNLERELETSRAQSFDLKRQLQIYVSEVRRAEELLNRKENERTEMLNHFRSLSLEATVLENNNHSLESEAAEARGALQTATDRMLDLEQQLADKESLIRSYETQITDLTQSVASLETQLRQHGEQKHRTEADLTAVRDLCMKLDQQKDTLMQQLDEKDSLKSQYDMQIAKLKAEQSVIQDQMAKDRATVERLEMLLDQARQESITVQANNQELQNEMTRLRQKMSELQNKLSSESSKLRQYQNQAGEYCKQISELRRQVTNERFDRARKEEENRRHSEGPPDSLVQTPLPNNQISNVSNDTKHRQVDWLKKPYTAIPKYPHTLSGARSVNERHSFPLDCKCLPSRNFPHNPSPNTSPFASSTSNSKADVSKQNDSKNNDRPTKPPSLNSTPDSFNCDTSKQYDGRIERSMMVISTDILQSRPLSEENNCKCNQIKEAQHDVPRISIIVRSDCKMHSGQYNYVQKESIQNESTSVLPNNEGSMKTDLRALKLSQSNLSNKKYDNTACNTENCFDISQPKELQYTEECNQGNEASTINNVSQIQYSSSLSPWTHPPELYYYKFHTDTVKTKLFPKVSTANLRKPAMLRGDTAKALDVTSKELPLKNFAVKKLDNSMKGANDSNKVSEKTKRDVTFDLETTNKAKEGFTDIEKTYLKSSLKSPANSMGRNLKFETKSASFNSEFRITENSIKRASFKARRNLIKSSELVNTVCTNQMHKYINNYEAYKAPERHESGTPFIDPIRTRKLTNLLIQKDVDFCTDANCSKTNGIALNNRQKDEYCNTTAITHFLKSERDSHDSECEKKCITTIDSALDILQNMLQGVKKLKSKETTQSKVRSYANKEVRCKNRDCNYVDAKNEKITSKHYDNSLNATELMRPECMKMLQEIKKHTETLEEQLIIMNKSMRARRKTNEKSVTICENSKAKQQRDIITQNPEKRNIYVQEPCLIDGYVKCPQNRLLKSGNNPGCVREQSRTIQEISEKSKKDVRDTNHREGDAKSQKLHHINNLRDVKNLQCQCKKPLPFCSFGITNFLPAATLKSETLNLQNYKKSFCYISNCTQTDSTSNENLPIIQNKKTVSNESKGHSVDRKKKTTDSTCVNDEQGSSACDEDTDTMLLLAKGVNNKYLKSKYKKMEFLNFRPKCIINSCIMCDQRSIRCRLPKRKAQIPIVFKLKSLRCKTENCHANTSNRMQFLEHSPNNCNYLVTTVWTQSSNSKITTATSVPSICCNDENTVGNCIKKSTAEREVCILS